MQPLRRLTHAGCQDSSSRAALISILLATALVPAAVEAQGVKRCEAPDGKVTYSNTECPEGSKAVRHVNTSPPIAVGEQKAAKDRAKREAAEAKEAEKANQAREKEETQAAERAAAEQKKAQAKERERCERAQRELDRARDARATLMQQQAATIEQVQKADREIGKQEAVAAKACPG